MRRGGLAGEKRTGSEEGLAGTHPADVELEALLVGQAVVRLHRAVLVAAVHVAAPLRQPGILGSTERRGDGAQPAARCFSAGVHGLEPQLSLSRALPGRLR